MTDHTMKTLDDQYPGKMAIADVRGTYSGVRVKTFTADHPGTLDADINEFFEKNEGLLVVDTHFYGGPGYFIATLSYTAQVDAEYIQAIARYGEEIKRKLAEEKAAQLEAEAAAEKAQEDAQKKVRELAEAGRKCVQHHAPLVEENRKLKDELKKARKK